MSVTAASLGLLSLDTEWRNGLTQEAWPGSCLPDVIGDVSVTMGALIREYLFVPLFRGCAECLASENASRLVAMRRADKPRRKRKQ